MKRLWMLIPSTVVVIFTVENIFVSENYYMIPCVLVVTYMMGSYFRLAHDRDQFDQFMTEVAKRNGR